VVSNAEARSISDFSWEIDEKYQRDGNVQFFASTGSKNILPIGIRGLNDVTVDLHPTINFDQTGTAKLPRGVNIYFEPSEVTVAKDEVKIVNLVIDVANNAPSNLYDVQIVGIWKEEGRIPDFMGSSFRLHVGRDFGDGKIPINMMDPPLKFWKLVQNDKEVSLVDVPCRNDYVLIVKSSSKSPACVTFQTGDILVKRGWATCDDGIDHGRGHPCGPRSSGIVNFEKDAMSISELGPEQTLTFDYQIESDDVTYGSQYQILGGTVDKITYDKHSNSLIVSLKESDKGFLQILIQIGLLHSLDQSPFTYFVIVDGEEVEFDKLSPILLKIPFEKNTKKIEIIGTNEI